MGFFLIVSKKYYKQKLIKAKNYLIWVFFLSNIKINDQTLIGDY